MKIEGDYIIFNPEETKALTDRRAGDQWSFNMEPYEWSSVGGLHGRYENSMAGMKYCVRRRLTACTPEQLAEAGRSEFQHFL